MGKVYDIEEARQKAKDRAKESPPFICLKSKDGKTRIIPKWEKGPDGEWRIMHLDSIKAMLGMGMRKRQIEILIGNCHESLTELLSKMMEIIVKDSYDLRLRSASHGEDLLELAKSSAVDIIILVLNNIMFRSPLHSSKERLERSLQLVTQIKTTYGKPVIALSGWLEDSSYIARAKLAADFFLPLGFKGDAFEEVLKKCFDMLPGFDVVT